jgi:hypothetical protein
MFYKIVLTYDFIYKYTVSCNLYRSLENQSYQIRLQSQIQKVDRMTIYKKIFWFNSLLAEVKEFLVVNKFTMA